MESRVETLRVTGQQRGATKMERDRGGDAQNKSIRCMSEEAERKRKGRRKGMKSRSRKRVRPGGFGGSTQQGRGGA